LLRNTNNSCLRDEVRGSSIVFVAMLRPYVNKNWTLEKRMDALEQHYRVLEAKGRLLSFNEKQYFDLIKLGPEYADLRVMVDKPRWMRSEGEIAVSLFCRDHRIYTAMLLVTGTPGNNRLVIGAIQGWGMPHAREVYVELTHALHGLRPRDLLINVLKMLAANLGCSEIHGISDSCHKSNHRLSSATKSIGYDEIWQEYGGRLNSEGFFVISTELKKREPAEIPSRKRAQYRRRYELIDYIRSRIDHSFSANERVLVNHHHLANKEAAPEKCGVFFQVLFILFHDLSEVADLGYLWNAVGVC
jgi:uncharacterized protein VirK/YbjX